MTILKFPVDAPKQRVVKTLELLGFRLIREREHISMERINPDGSKTHSYHTQPSKDKIINAENNLHTGRDSTG